MLGSETLVILENMSRIMAEKMDKPILHLRAWVNGQIEIAVATSYPKMISGAELPSPIQEKEPDFDLVLGLRMEN